MHITLRDGRRTAIAEYGARDGRPVLYCHGFPASHIDAELADEAGRELGARIIAPDRPGYGLSDFQPGRRLADWPRDAAEIADALGVARFAVLAVSGGAPYGLACAALLPERVTALGVVCGLGPMGTRAECAGFNPFARASFWLARNAPRASALFNRLLAPALTASPRLAFALLAAQLPPPDRAALADEKVYAILSASLREAFRQGASGATHDLALYANAWGFDPRVIGAPSYLWHGEQDTTVPVAIGRRTACALPGCRSELYADEGHFSLPVRRMRSILGALCAHD